MGKRPIGSSGAFEEVEFQEGVCICKQGNFWRIQIIYISSTREIKALEISWWSLMAPCIVEVLWGTWLWFMTRHEPLQWKPWHQYHFLELKASNNNSKEIDSVIDQIAGLKSKYDGDIIRRSNRSEYGCCVNRRALSYNKPGSRPFGICRFPLLLFSSFDSFVITLSIVQLRGRLGKFQTKVIVSSVVYWVWANYG